MHLEACLQLRLQCLPFFTSVDGIMDVEAVDILKRITIRLTTKWHQPYSKTCGYVKSRIAITFVRANQRCIRGSRVQANQISGQ